MTLPKVALNIIDGRKNLAVFYVSISRVKRMEDLMFKQSFNLDRLIGSSSNIATIRKID